MECGNPVQKKCRSIRDVVKKESRHMWLAGAQVERWPGYGFDTRNAEGKRVLEFATANGLRVGKTWFKKRTSHLITYSSGGHSTQLDYILYPKWFSSSVSKVKVIPQEEIVQQHHLIVCDFTVHIPPVKKYKFSPRIRSWKLRDSATASLFQEIFKEKVITATATAAADASTSQVESAWSKLKRPLLDTVIEVCGVSKNHQWKLETWWWNECVEDAVQEKCACFKAYNNLRKQGLTTEANAAKTVYNDAKRVAKRVIWLAKLAAGPSGITEMLKALVKKVLN